MHSIATLVPLHWGFILCILFYAFYSMHSIATLVPSHWGFILLVMGGSAHLFFKRADNFSSEKHVTCSLDARKNGRRSEIPEAQILARYKNRSCTPAGLLALKLQLKHTGRGERRSNGPEKPQRTQVQCRRKMKTTLEMDVSQSVLLPQQLVSSINLRWQLSLKNMPLWCLPFTGPTRAKLLRRAVQSLRRCQESTTSLLLSHSEFRPNKYLLETVQLFLWPQKKDTWLDQRW